METSGIGDAGKADRDPPLHSTCNVEGLCVCRKEGCCGEEVRREKRGGEGKSVKFTT